MTGPFDVAAAVFLVCNPFDDADVEVNATGVVDDDFGVVDEIRDVTLALVGF